MSLPSGGVFDLGWPLVTLTALAGVLLDQVFGEMSRQHPLASFGHITAVIERCINRASAMSVRSRVVSLVAWTVTVLPFVLLVAWLIIMVGDVPPRLVVALDTIALYSAIDARSLYEHITSVVLASHGTGLPRAHAPASRIVPRDLTQTGNEPIARVAMESALENGGGAVFVPLFWLVVTGTPGVMLYRLTNMLDAIWDYRNARFTGSGWAAARTDDVLSWIPARLMAMSYALLSHTADALCCWRTQAPQWSNPNTDPVMAAGAGNLRARLGGAACYEGVEEARSPFGTGKLATAVDVIRALTLVSHTLWLWLGVLDLITTSAWGLS